jgi:ligand-binding sensor domain-containing protein
MKNALLFCLFVLTFISCKKDDGETGPFPDNVSDNILKDYVITAIAFDQSGTAWLGTLNQGLIRHDANKTTVFNSTNSILSDASILDIKTDKKGNVWIGSDDLIRYDGSKFTRYDSKQFNLPRNHIGSIAIDGSDQVWFSCGSFRSGGLVKYDGTRFTTFTPENSDLPGNLIQSLAIDSQDHLWVAVNDAVSTTSLVKIEGSKWRVFGEKEIGIKPYNYGSIVTNMQNELLVSIDYMLSSTMISGRPQIFRFNGNKANIIALPDENLIIYQTHKIFSDSNNHLWASFWGDQNYGIFKDGSWNLRKLDTDGIFAFGEKTKGEIWLGTGKGIFIIK